MLFMLIIKAKYWLFNYKLPGAGSGCRLAGLGRVGGTCHTRQILQITQASPPSNGWAGIKEIIHRRSVC